MKCSKVCISQCHCKNDLTFFKEWKSLFFANRSFPSYSHVKSPHSYSMDQGGFRSLHHIVGHEVKWCFFDFNPTLIRIIVWHPSPFVNSHGILKLWFGRQIIAKPLTTHFFLLWTWIQWEHWFIFLKESAFTLDSVTFVRLVKYDSDFIFLNERPWRRI